MSMSYVTRMCLRMYAPAVLLFAGGIAAAAVIKAVQEAPGDMGGLAVYSNLPNWCFAIGIGAGVAVATLQTVRLQIWERGRARGCYVCGCLLGQARSGRLGLGHYRRCLGCGKSHGMNHHVLVSTRSG
jgi:hypothetical protein